MYLLSLPEYGYNEDLGHQVMHQLAHASLELTQPTVNNPVSLCGGGFVLVGSLLPFPVERPPALQAGHSPAVDNWVDRVVAPGKVC